jgi:drug/metabolite transporter (DMT)-like permease
MNDKVVFYASFILIGTFISSAAQVLLKKAAMKEHCSVKDEYLNKNVIIAYITFVLATFLSIYAYKGIPLSMGAVLESTSYLYITIFGAYFFKEKITMRKIVAIVFIIVGIAIYSYCG